MFALTLLFLALAALGHAAFWVGVVNRWHATGYPRAVVKSVTLLFYAALLLPIGWVAWQMARHGRPALDMWDWELTPRTAYLACAAAYGAAHLVIWTRRRWHARRHPEAVTTERQRVVDVADVLGAPPCVGPRTTLLSRVPFNQLWRLHVREVSIEIAGLPSELEGLSICHWSDLHMSGRIDRPYFREVVRLTNEMPVDLLALTGDVCDSARYFDWIEGELAHAKARLGKYFILGNHDIRTRDVPRLRAVLGEAGFVDVGGRALAIAQERILLAGDERPWFQGEPRMPETAPGDALRLLLAHTPDRLPWARRQNFQLMLAGHTHGGQVRLPLVGPTVCPSWYGTRYAAGYFHEPPTMLHVSRGTGSLFPLRWGCPPEITRIVLRRQTRPA